MSIDITKLKHDYFIHSTIKKNGYAIHSVRIGILNAVNKLRDRISGDVVDIGYAMDQNHDFRIDFFTLFTIPYANGY
jgi:hypothetical protein